MSVKQQAIRLAAGTILFILLSVVAIFFCGCAYHGTINSELDTVIGLDATIPLPDGTRLGVRFGMVRHERVVIPTNSASFKSSTIATNSGLDTSVSRQVEYRINPALNP